MCVNLTADLLSAKHLTIGNQWKEGHALTEVQIFNMVCMFFPERRRNC